MASFYLDRHKLPDSFLTEYIGELEREEMDFGADIKAISEKIKDDYDYCLESTGREPNIFLLVSPYFAGRITACLPERITAGSVSADGSGDPAGEKGTAAVKADPAQSQYHVLRRRTVRCRAPIPMKTV